MSFVWMKRKNFIRNHYPRLFIKKCTYHSIMWERCVLINGKSFKSKTSSVHNVFTRIRSVNARTLEKLNGKNNTSLHIPVQFKDTNEQNSDKTGNSEKEQGLHINVLRTPEMLRLETLLFLSREPLGAKRLSQFLGCKDVKTVIELVGQLNQFYDKNRYAFRILDFAGGFQIRIRPQFTPWLRRLCHQEMEDRTAETPEIRLSPPAMETLAIIAYRQPVVRAEIESIRGVQCGEIIRLLLGRDLIRIAGRSDELGRPFLYETTRKFLEIFGLKSLAQLPQIVHSESEK
ncbi:MAG: SMC-Scp complex subunit ScpB [Planctomycetia bacterium]|nr:SMC-Scp complex subunit ScpB [Planctomycetia bacterium]